MKSRRLWPVPLLVRGLLALSRAVRRHSVSAFSAGRLGPGPTRRLLAVADALTSRAAWIALRARTGTPMARNASWPSRDRVEATASSRGCRSVLMVSMRTLPVGLLAVTLWPGSGLIAVMAVVACAGLSAALRGQSPIGTQLTDWDVAVALCFCAIVSERVLL